MRNGNSGDHKIELGDSSDLKVEKTKEVMIDSLVGSQVTIGQPEKAYFNTMCTEPDESTTKRLQAGTDSRGKLTNIVKSTNTKFVMP